MIALHRIKRTDPRILANMAIHYSAPGGFVGRNICYAVLFAGVFYGTIVGGSSTLHLPGRDAFFGMGDTHTERIARLNQIVNNTFYHVEKGPAGRYPCRWFTVEVLAAFRRQVAVDWQARYGDPVIGFESLVELPRTGECYRRDGWQLVGQTKGFTCKRVAGKSTDAWSGKRVWDYENLRPKHVFVRRVDADVVALPALAREGVA